MPDGQSTTEVLQKERLFEKFGSSLKLTKAPVHLCVPMKSAGTPNLVSSLGLQLKRAPVSVMPLFTLKAVGGLGVPVSSLSVGVSHGPYLSLKNCLIEASALSK